jgi:hypothetical protein
VPDQGAEGPGLAVEEEGEVGGEGQPIDLRHQQAEAILLYEVVQPGQVGFGEGGRDVHRHSPLPTGGHP